MTPNGIPTVGDVPALTREQMQEVDRVMVDELHIQLLQMMENAGRHLADLAVRRFAPANAVVLAGAGGNGGGGLVAARHLSNRGVDVAVVLSRPAAEFTPVAAHQLDILERVGVAVVAEPVPAAVIVDAVIGYGLRGDPTGRAAAFIAWANDEPSPILALDIPSGLDANGAGAAHPCIRAAATLALALPKAGSLDASEVGELYLADISVPPHVYAAFGVHVPAVFEHSTVVRVAIGTGRTEP
jgi:NAD(P)H-hydrate epimerase